MPAHTSSDTTAGFAHPEPEGRATSRPARVEPVFLPFAGCPHRCAFCDQQATSGTRPRPLENIFQEVEARLSGFDPSGPVELAFYGGTFTALPEPWPQRFLELAARFRTDSAGKGGPVVRVRCSTRPDAVAPALLAELKALGLDAVELGVQSFHDPALEASGRGYGGQAAVAGCCNVRLAGMELGIQLMPGLPTPEVQTGVEVFRDDVAAAAGLGPDMVRLYPCLVLEGTPLADRWRAGTYRPWSLETTVAELGRATLEFWKRGVPVIRTGLAPEPSLAERVLAGPVHPALGQLVRSEALFLHVSALAATCSTPPTRLLTPRRWLSDTLGHAKSQAPRYAALGITDIRPHDGDLFKLA